MINTDLLPGAPVCLDLVMNAVAFTATNTAVWIIIAAWTVLVMLTVATDGEFTITGAGPSYTTSFNWITKMSWCHFLATVMAGHNSAAVPDWGQRERGSRRWCFTQLLWGLGGFLMRFAFVNFQAISGFKSSTTLVTCESIGTCSVGDSNTKLINLN